MKKKRGVKQLLSKYENKQVVEQTIKNSSFEGESNTIRTIYDGTSVKKVEYSPQHFVEYEYDQNGKMTNEKATLNGGTTFTETKYIYNSEGKIITKQIDTSKINYSYDKFARLSSMTYGNKIVSYVYDDNDKLTQVKLGNEVIRKYYYRDNQLSSIKNYDMNALHSEHCYEYDSKNRISTITYKNAGGAEQEKHSLTYDNEDQVVKEVIVENYTGKKTTTKEYEYDWLGQLTQDTINGVSTNYIYDAVGNRTSMKKGTDIYSYVYGDFDELLLIKKNNANDTTYQYDINGNLKTSTKDNQTTKYEFNKANQLTKVSKNDDELATYTYDATGQRLSKQVGDTSTDYLYNGTFLLSTQVNGRLSEHNILDPSGDMVVGLRINSQRYWYHEDMRGSVTNIIDSNHQTMVNYTYEAYGKTNKSSSDFVNSFAYTGAIIDDETGLYYMNARYYSPENATFVNRDSYTGDGDSYWNLYNYCFGNPVGYTDRTGNMPETPWARLKGTGKYTYVYYRGVKQQSNYNCYGYAIGVKSFVSPGYKSYSAATLREYYQKYHSVSTVANHVKNDVRKLKGKNAYKSLTYNQAITNRYTKSGFNTIALRVTTKKQMKSLGAYDFHFARRVGKKYWSWKAGSDYMYKHKGYSVTSYAWSLPKWDGSYITWPRKKGQDIRDSVRSMKIYSKYKNVYGSSTKYMAVKNSGQVKAYGG